MFEWDEAKRRHNLAKHGVDFDAVWDMDWPNAVRINDGRYEYGEIRYIALAYIEARLFTCVYKERSGQRRIISLRKASKKEERLYETEICNH